VTGGAGGWAPGLPGGGHEMGVENIRDVWTIYIWVETI